MTRYTKHTLPSGYIDICVHGDSGGDRVLLTVLPDGTEPNERLAEWLRECLSIGLGSCTLELAAPDMLAALKLSEQLLDEAIEVHVYGDDDERDPDGPFITGIATVRAAIAKAEGRSDG